MMNTKIYPHILQGAIALLLAWGLSSCGLFAPQSYRGATEGAEGMAMQAFLVGTYTESSEGVYTFSYNPKSRAVKHRGTFVTPNPTGMVLDHNRGILYIANRLEHNATASSAQLDGVSGRLSAINSSYTLGGSPSAIATDGKGKVVTANYSGGSITLFGTDEHGLLGSPDWHIVLGKEGVSHPTSLCFSPDGKELFVVDSGQDKLFHFNVNATNPPLTIDVATTDLPKGTSPKELTMDASGRYAYLITGERPQLYIFRHRGGVLTPVHTFSLGGERGYHVALSPDGNHLYTSSGSNGRGLMTIFRVDRSSGQLTKVGEQQVGSGPVHFAINATGRVVAVASLRGDRVEFYARDRQSGMLTPMKDLGITISKPAYILWAF